MKINDYVFKYRVVKAYETKALEGYYESGVMLIARTPHVVCKDGFSMSVQANFSAYSNIGLNFLLEANTFSHNIMNELGIERLFVPRVVTIH